MKAFVVDTVDGEFARGVREIDPPPLAEGEVAIAVEWSDVNYKDALAGTAEGKVVRANPMVTGIDLAGTVVTTRSPNFAVGDQVLATGYDLGVARWGGHAQFAHIPADWALPLPPPLDGRAAMQAGTAGLTAALCTLAITEGSSDGQVLVTGAAGGVGSYAVALLAAAGFEVTASTGRQERSDWLRALGAQDVVGRLSADHRPLERERWSGVVDTVGGQTLAAALAATAHDGVVAACGMTGGAAFTGSVFPFILRGVTLRGIDSVLSAPTMRTAAWGLVAALSPEHVALLAGRVVGLEDLAMAMDEVLAGSAVGRTVVKVAS